MGHLSFQINIKNVFFDEMDFMRFFNKSLHFYNHLSLISYQQKQTRTNLGEVDRLNGGDHSDSTSAEKPGRNESEG